MNPWFTMTVTDGAEVTTWTVPQWAFWAAVAVLSLPTILTLAFRVYFQWRWARARIARGKVLDKLAAVWGYERWTLGINRKGGRLMETDQQLRQRIHTGKRFR